MGQELHHSDEELLTRVKGGDKIAFRRLFDRHYRTLLGTAINILRDLDKGKDAVQEVLLNLWQKRDQIEVRGEVGTYLKRSVINRALNQIRREKPFVETAEVAEKPLDAASAVDQLAHAQLQEALQAALAQLPERCRLVFVLKRLEGLSQKEIAAQLDISTKTVENQITKAAKHLAEALKAYRERN